MANKRIELEQYKHYLDLLQEEPNRKTWRKGMEVAFIAMALLTVAMFVLGTLSGSLATNAGNVLEKPPAKQTATPEGTVTPGTETPYSPTEQQQIPITPEQQPSPGSRAPSAPRAGRASFGIPLGADGGDLIAQAQTDTPDAAQTVSQTDVSQSVPIDMQQTAPVDTSSSAPAQQSGNKSKGPDKQTKGVGNLANLANGLQGRGFQLYLLILLIVLLVILYLPVRKARLEGKSK
jgi:hypothetical protein